MQLPAAHLCTSKWVSLQTLVWGSEGHEGVHQGRKTKGLSIVWHLTKGKPGEPPPSTHANLVATRA